MTEQSPRDAATAVLKTARAAWITMADTTGYRGEGLCAALADALLAAGWQPPVSSGRDMTEDISAVADALADYKLQIGPNTRSLIADGSRPQRPDWQSGDTTIRTSCECGARSGDLEPTTHERCQQWWREHVERVTVSMRDEDCDDCGFPYSGTVCECKREDEGGES